MLVIDEEAKEPAVEVIENIPSVEIVNDEPADISADLVAAIMQTCDKAEQHIISVEVS